MKKAFLILLALLMLLQLAACEPTQDPAPSDTDTASGTEGETDAAERILSLVVDGASEYRIVRSETASETVASATNALRNALKNITGVELKITSDISALTENGDNAAKKEIIIGKTRYEETATALAECGYGDFVIRVYGNKIVVVAHDDSVTAKGCTYLSDILLKYGERGSLSIPEGELNVTRAITQIVSALPQFEGAGAMQLVDAGDGAYMMVVQKSNQESFQSYCQSIENAGYTLYTSHSASGNNFYTYVNDQYTINTYYRPYDRSIRVAVEPRGLLPLTEAPQYEKLTTPSVTMLGLEIDGNQIGLCLIFRLSNGHFVILDGGNNKKVYADRIYQKLQELAIDKNNIVIDAWIISHGHTDHAGGMMQFQKHYSKQVTVKQFISNIPPEAKLLEINDLTTESAARNAMKQFPNVTLTKAHAGQIFYFADAKIEMLYTVEDLYPKALEDGNSASLVFRITLGGQTIMCLGDEYMDASLVLTSAYTGMYLKSDFVQVSHHGWEGATVALYNQIKPDVALWPVGLEYYAKQQHLEQNKALKALIKDLYVSGSTDVTLSLPYTLQNNKEANG